MLPLNGLYAFQLCFTHINKAELINKHIHGSAYVTYVLFDTQLKNQKRKSFIKKYDEMC